MYLVLRTIIILSFEQNEESVGSINCICIAYWYDIVTKKIPDSATSSGSCQHSSLEAVVPRNLSEKLKIETTTPRQLPQKSKAGSHGFQVALVKIDFGWHCFETFHVYTLLNVLHEFRLKSCNPFTSYIRRKICAALPNKPVLRRKQLVGS